MKLRLTTPAKLLLGAGTFAAAFAGDVSIGSTGQVSLVTPAYARIGRPLTPLSYAGVARRTTRRAVYAGAAYGAAVRPVVVAPAPVVVVQPTCVDTVDAYGRVTRVCR